MKNILAFFAAAILLYTGWHSFNWAIPFSQGLAYGVTWFFTAPAVAILFWLYPSLGMPAKVMLLALWGSLLPLAVWLCLVDIDKGYWLNNILCWVLFLANMMLVYRLNKSERSSSQ